VVSPVNMASANASGGGTASRVRVFRHRFYGVKLARQMDLLVRKGWTCESQNQLTRLQDGIFDK